MRGGIAMGMGMVMVVVVVVVVVGMGGAVAAAVASARPGLAGRHDDAVSGGIGILAGRGLAAAAAGGRDTAGRVGV
ncbi:hypothetical protein B0T24DRAFT_633391, partial [Lasiosphaeria ovina]